MSGRPGATRSGLVTPAAVGPREDQAATLSAVGERSSYAPTVRTMGSSAGLVIAPGTGPAFPAATTTTTPSSQRRSTATSSGSVVGSWEDGVPHERLRTLMLNRARLSSTQLIAARIVDASTDPSARATLTATTVARGATPVYPPFRRDAESAP